MWDRLKRLYNGMFPGEPQPIGDGLISAPSYDELARWLISLSDLECSVCHGLAVYWEPDAEPCPVCLAWKDKNADSSLLLLINFVKRMNRYNQQRLHAEEILGSFRNWLKTHHVKNDPRMQGSPVPVLPMDEQLLGAIKWAYELAIYRETGKRIDGDGPALLATYRHSH